MKLSGNTVLITGGGTGIGRAIAEEFLRQGSEVLICGRRGDKLKEAQEKLPGIHARRCDLAVPEDRQALLEWATGSFPRLNVLINNAGIQKMVDFTQGMVDLQSEEDEIEINFSVPVLLSALFIPHLMNQPESAIMNVSSGLAFIPIASMPVYCATKAALHSFTRSLRFQLKDTPIKVFEIIPPTVDSQLDRGSRDLRGMTDRGITSAETARAALDSVARDEYEIAIGGAQFLRRAFREEPEQQFLRMNAHE